MTRRAAPAAALLVALSALSACRTTPEAVEDVAASRVSDGAPRLTVPSAGDSAVAASAEGTGGFGPGAAPADVVLDRERWVFAGRTGEAITTPHFVIRTTLPQGVLLWRLPGFAERALLHYTSALGPLPMPPRRLETYMMATRPQWEDVTRRVGGSNAPIYLSIRRGGFAASGTAVYWDIGEHDALQIAAHEGWHQYTQATFRQPLPIWLEEGLATFMEGFRWRPGQQGVPMFLPWANAERFDRLRTLAARDGLMPLDELLTARPQDLLATSDEAGLRYYAQAWALTHFLAEGDDGAHAPALRAMLNDAAAGSLYGVVAERVGREAAVSAARRRVGPAVFEAYFGADLDAADARYRAFIQRVVRPGGRDAIVAGRSPLLPG